MTIKSITVSPSRPLMTQEFRKIFTREIMLWIGLVIILIGGAYAISRNPTLIAVQNDTPFKAAISYCWITVLFMTLGYFVFLGVLVCCYRPRRTLTTEELPRCTIIVPAYNEGRHVSETLDSLLAADYPADKLEIIAINDGSRDDTWDWIQQSARSSHGRIRPINLEKNGGKKHALYMGVLQAKHEIIITVDSDSLVRRQSLRNIVAPFQDAKIGAVAGNIRVKNPTDSFIAAMMDVTFVFGCEFMRAAQSVTGTVVCTPGALSAYRRSVIVPCLDEWLDQTFLGGPATIGEDRAITTLILRSGYHVVHQGNAVADTCVPKNYRGLCKMLIRWTRSDIRENLQMSSFLFSNFSLIRMRPLIFQIHWLALMLGIVLPFIFLPVFVYLLLFSPGNPLTFLLINATAGILWAIIPAVIYARRSSLVNSIWAFVYGLFNPLALSWICVYSCLTVRNSKWLTR